MKNRNFTRIPFRTEATVKYGDVEVRGEVQNLSLNGMFMKTGEKIPIGEEVEVVIHVAGASSKLTMDLVAIVARHIEEGMGLRFMGMYLDVFLYLRAIISLSLGDKNKVMDEFMTFMKGRDSESD